MRAKKIGWFTAALVFIAAFSSQAAGGLVVSRLQCEYRSDPLGIDVVNPLLSWIVASDERGAAQTAYRIIVASSRELLGRGTGDLWDTGKVLSDETIGIVYQGTTLGTGRQCFWKVMVWDRADSPSEWSDAATWSMGLLSASDWQAQWIGMDTPSGEIHDLHVFAPPPITWDLKLKVPGSYGTQKLLTANVIRVYLPAPYLRKSFTARGPVRRATVYVTALGLYELHLNGARVGDDYFTPGWSDYRERVYYQTYDVTGMVHTGDNAIGAVLSDGWYAGNIGLKGQRFYGDKLRLRARLVLEYEDGSTEAVVTDGSWKASAGPIREADIQAGEVYDARKEMPGWDGPGFDDGGWRAVDVTDSAPMAVEAYPGIPVRATEEIVPFEVTEPKPGVFVFNMGQNFAGWARLRVSGSAGDRVVMKFGEMKNPDGTVYTANLRSARATDTYVLKGGGEEIWEPRFTYHGFQYVEVTGYPGEPGPDAITGIVAHSDLALTGSFECSDALVNKIYSNLTWGQRSNYFEVPTDCPQRDERLGWTGDAQIFARTATYNMDVAPFFTKWMVDLTDGQHKSGGFPDVAPDVLGGEAAGWGDAGIICPYTMYLVYGDRRIIERHYEAMTRFMEFYDRRSPGGLSPPLGAYGDWVNIKDPTPLDLVTTAYHAYDASLMARMAEAVGRADDAKMYRERLEKIKAAFNRAFVSDDGKVSGDSQTAYLMALGFDLLPDDQRALATKRLVGKLADNDYCLSTGFLGLKMLLPTLTDVGRLDLAYGLLTNRKFPSWGYSIDQGATTIWERWNSYTIEKGFGPVSMNSFNHYAFGSVGEWLFRDMAGIDTDDPAYKKIVIHPRPGGGITWAKASYDSVRGPIVSNWDTRNGMVKLDVTIPANTTAVVYVPAGPDGEVLVDGSPAAKAPGVLSARREGKAMILEVGSGSYSFTGRMQ